MRSACVVGLALAVLLAGGPSQAREDPAKAKPNPNVTIIVIDSQTGPGGGPVAPRVLAGWTLTPPGGLPAAGPAASQVKAPPPDDLLGGPFQAMDKDKDGKIGKAEFKGPAVMFESIDANRDGSITRPEAIRYLAFVGLMSLQEKARAFQAADSNKDGKLSQSEFKGTGERFAQLDANHDGEITREEAIRAFQGYVRRAMRLARLRAMDINHDGLISAAEFKGPKPAFARLNADHDGTISRAELGRVFPFASPLKPDVPAKPVASTPKAPAVTPAKAVKPVPVKVTSQAASPAVQGRWLKRIMDLDINKDGKVCKSEFMKGREARFSALDRDKDGAITTAELSKAVAARKARIAAAIKPATVKADSATATPRGRRFGLMSIMSMDANKDGKVSKDEFLKGVEARFTFLDQDKDGFITTTDLTKVAAARRSGLAPASKPAATGKSPKATSGQPAAKGVKTAGIVK
jgi:Ca2+-binding EF-hand superfamily protein